MRVVLAAAGMLAASSVAYADAPTPLAAVTVNASPPRPAGARPVVVPVKWLRTPAADDLARLYPEEAIRDNVEGHTRMVCAVALDGTLHDCVVTAETPTGHGFGDAALRSAPLILMQPATVNGTPVATGKITIPMRWVLPQDSNLVIETPNVDLPPTSVDAPDPVYPEAARAAGHQGEVWVSGTVGADGGVSNVRIKRRSHSRALDRAAQEAFATWTFTPGRNAKGEPVDTIVSTRLVFYKDNIFNLDQKSCADFVTDVRWFSAAFPQLRRSDMRVYRVGLDLFTTASRYRSATAAGTSAMTRRYPAAFDQTFDQCVATPRSGFLEVLKSKAL